LQHQPGFKMRHYFGLFLLLMLCSCSNDTQAEKPHAVKSVTAIDIKAKNIIALNHSNCLLSEKSEIFCWEAKKQGPVQAGELKQVDLGGNKALNIYGNSGDEHYFNTGYHGCALLENNSIRCWGKISEDSVFDADSIFDTPSRKENNDLIASYAVKKSILKKMGRIKKLVTNHGVVCSIDNKNTLYCPHPHLAFLNGKADIKSAVIGEILSCLQNTEDEIECYDMRGGSDKKPVYLNINGESWPKYFDFRYVYSAGITFIANNGGALYWQGSIPQWDKFPGVYGIESSPIKLAKNVKATAIHMSETTTCLQLDDGSATCWGQPIGENNAKGIISAPGLIVKFNNRKIIDIALGLTSNCFLLSDSTIECFIP